MKDVCKHEGKKTLGQAITARALQPETILAKVFITWLQKLFKD